MPTPKLSKKLVAEIRRLKALGYSHERIHQATGASMGSVSRFAHDVDRLEKDIPKKPDQIEEYAKYHREKFLELQARFDRWIGNVRKVKAPPKKSSRRKKALVINDVHVPFHDEKALAYAISHNSDADECWVVGDLLDLFTFSRYDKYSRPFSPIEEFQAGQMVINKLAETFPVVRVLHGNHDERFIKYLVRDKGIPPDVIDFLKFRYPTFCSPLANMCEGISNVEMMQPKKIDYATYGFIHQIGDCVLSHAERYSKVPAKTVSDVIEAAKKKLEPMGVVNGFRVLAHAHTHTAAKVWGDYNVVGIELGCLARTPDYDGNPRIMGRKPIIGYTLIYQEEGKTDINASNFYEISA